MPLFWYAIMVLPSVNLRNGLLVFAILHLLVYPASNGYNSYMDRDEGPIGGLEKPLQPTRQLLYTCAIMDMLAVLLSYFISIPFLIGIIIYILISRAYSYRGVRLKRFGVMSFLLVVLVQGCLTFAMVYHGCHPELVTKAPIIPMISAGLMIGSFYPISQIYQHEADKKDGVKTISMMLGIRGTFLFCIFIYTIAFVLLGLFLSQSG